MARFVRRRVFGGEGLRLLRNLHRRALLRKLLLTEALGLIHYQVAVGVEADAVAGERFLGLAFGDRAVDGEFAFVLGAEKAFALGDDREALVSAHVADGD